MSAVQSEAYKSASSLSIPFITRTENFTNANLTHDTLLEFGLLTKSIKVTNNDALGSLQIITQSPSGTPIILDPSSEIVIDGWTSFIQIIPNAVSGTGQIEIDLVQTKEALK